MKVCSMDESKVVRVCGPDFSKAFESFSHFLLNCKQPNFGKSGLGKQSVILFLGNPSFASRVGNYESGWKNVTIAVTKFVYLFRSS